MKANLNTVVGDRELCAWQPVRGIVWVQTRDPKYARRLAKRKDGQLVAIGVPGGFLRTYEFARPLGWAVRLISRYTASETSANETFNCVESPERHSEVKGATNYDHPSGLIDVLQ